MELVEIKNNLAKLHYEPMDFPLVLSDFLTIDDGNKKIIAQVVSIESTDNDTTNSALIKFSLNLNPDNTFDNYDGYVPALDALISKTKKQIIESIFSDEKSDVYIGKLTNSIKSELKLNHTLTENFLYIQSDRPHETRDVLKKIINFNKTNNRKTLYLDFDGMIEFDELKQIKLGKEFKIPISAEILSYIYENDLTGLTVEQKAIVQDIILEIQEYIKTLDNGYIPFDTLLNVVNELYSTDKSTGIILFRNKLLKYKELGIFASNEEELTTLENSIDNHTIVILNMEDISPNWANETVKFITTFIDREYYVVFDIKDEIIDKNIINYIYKAKNIKPIVSSKYESEFAAQAKAYAKNIILFRPLTQQKTFASYSSFMNKLNAKEFIVSGESTYFTPLIFKDFEPQLIENKKNIEAETITTENVIDNLEEIDFLNNNVDIEYSLTEDNASEINLHENIEENYSNDEYLSKQVEENPIEQEIAKDVDKMFYAESSPIQLVEDDEISIINENYILEDNSEDNGENNSFLLEENDLEVLDEVEVDNNEYETEINDGLINENILDTENIEIDEQIPGISISEENTNIAQNTNNNEPNIDVLFEKEPEETLPVYTTEIETKTTNNDIKIAEGNIVYHPKYGKGIVEQFVNCGNKTFCSVNFDNIGIRLLDPNIADLKQI